MGVSDQIPVVFGQCHAMQPNLLAYKARQLEDYLTSLDSGHPESNLGPSDRCKLHSKMLYPVLAEINTSSWHLEPTPETGSRWFLTQTTVFLLQM